MKHGRFRHLVFCHRVAPRAGAWIETVPYFSTAGLLVSPPARGRGLKLIIVNDYSMLSMSPPARGRGLKREHPTKPGFFVSRPPRGGVD